MEATMAVLPVNVPGPGESIVIFLFGTSNAVLYSGEYIYGHNKSVNLKNLVELKARWGLTR